MRLDHRFQPVHLDLGLEEADRALDLAFVGDVSDLLVVREPVLQLRVEPFLRPLADARHPRADGVQRAHELALIARKRGLEEDHVYGHWTKPIRWRSSLGRSR